MSFTIKVRGDSTGTVLHDYHCPVHGRFEASVPRANVPDQLPCPLPRDSEPPADPSYFFPLPGYAAAPDPHVFVPCERSSTWAPAPVTGRVKLGEVQQGKVMEYPPERVCLDTRELGDGMPLHEWRAKQAKITRDISFERARARRR